MNLDFVIVLIERQRQMLNIIFWRVHNWNERVLLFICKMQRSLKFYFGNSQSSGSASGADHPDASTKAKPYVLKIAPKKPPVGRPRKAPERSTRPLVEYSSTESECGEESANECPPVKKTLHCRDLQRKN